MESQEDEADSEDEADETDGEVEDSEDADEDDNQAPIQTPIQAPAADHIVFCRINDVNPIRIGDSIVHYNGRKYVLSCVYEIQMRRFKLHRYVISSVNNLDTYVVNNDLPTYTDKDRVCLKLIDNTNMACAFIESEIHRMLARPHTGTR